jgi:hypothetical protein
MVTFVTLYRELANHYFGYTVCDYGDVICRMEEKKEEDKPLDDDGDEDPAIEFQLNSDAHIHVCLLMPGLVAGLPASVPALTAGAGAGAGAAAISRENLIRWLDSLIDRYCKSARRVRDTDEVVIPGSYDRIMGHEYTTVISKPTNLSAWTADIHAAHESLGIVKVGGVGRSTTAYSKLKLISLLKHRHFGVLHVVLPHHPYLLGNCFILQGQGKEA